MICARLANPRFDFIVQFVKAKEKGQSLGHSSVDAQTTLLWSKITALRSMKRA